MTVATQEPVVLLTCDEACRALRISKNSLKRATDAGQIVATRIGATGRGVRYRLTELQRYADRMSAPAAAAG